MGKFNKSRGTLMGKNLSGNPAYHMDVKERLAVAVLTSFFNEQKYYGDNSERIIEDLREVAKSDPRFAANLAVYARREMNLRSIAHVITAELAQIKETKPYVREIISNVALRVDDMTEIMAYTLGVFGKPIPNSIKKGIRDKFISFNEYALAKYNRGGDVKLKDLILLTHPKGKNEKGEELIKKVLDDNLQVPKTWETMLSDRGNTKEVWEELIESGSLGYMAALRNLRNMIKADPKNINKIYDFISNREAVKKNRLLPFRYYTAYRMLKAEGIGTNRVYDALEDALEYSVENIEKLPGKTLIACDVSGSMSFYNISERSMVTCADIGTLLLSIANGMCEESLVRTFDTKLYKNPMSKRGGIISNAQSIQVCGGGTDITLPFKEIIKKKIHVDRIIILSDNEINCGQRVCQDYVDKYRRSVNKDVWLHAIDLQGYGTQQFCGERVNIMAGWSEKVLEFISKAENGVGSMIQEIDEYHFMKD